MNKDSIHYTNPRQWKRFHLYLEHLKKFMLEAQLLAPSGQGFVAVSGGLDSMTLLFMLSHLKNYGLISHLSAIHINHGTRKECGLEEELVEKFCLELNIPLIVESLNLSLESENFENHARKKRYEAFEKNCENGDVVYTAHHIDDSFEWNQMQQFKSSKAEVSLGVPVKRGVFRRPFNCFTRLQLERIARILKIPYAQDQSNQNTRFERNYYRENISHAIKKRFPKYLKHYVARSNLEAQRLKLSAFKNKVDKVHLYRDFIGGMVLVNNEFNNNFFGQEEKIIHALQTLSNEDRGTLSDQVQKIIKASQQGKKGPLTFSGGVLGFMEQGILFFVHKDSLDKYKELDTQLLNLLKNKSNEIKKLQLDNIPEIESLPFKKLAFPFLCFVPSGNLKAKGHYLKNPHDLWPKATEYALQQGIATQSIGKCFLRSHKESQKHFWLPVFCS